MKIITICGSMRFFERMFDEQIRLSKLGNVVLLPVIGMTNKEPDLTPEEKKLYVDIHFQKISMADEIFVINVGGYVGPSTAKEIELASTLGKAIKFLEVADYSLIESPLDQK